MPHAAMKSGAQLSARSIATWRAVQTLVWLVGCAIFLCLVFYPAIGLLLFWNILIPVAPALLVVATGLWRNICPLATTNLLPRHFNLSKGKKMPPRLQEKLQLAAIIALYIIVPLRHPLFNQSGPATAVLLAAAAITGVSMGFFYDWKSGWCSSLCPVSPVEKLYGGNTVFSFPNAHCGSCVNCSVPCPDATPDFNPGLGQKTALRKLNTTLIAGGLPGFIWGWFHVPDTNAALSFNSVVHAYALPFAGLLVTLTVYAVFDSFTTRKDKSKLISVFAAAAVSCYYWFRIPALLGFGKFADDGLLIRLTGVLPSWSMPFIISAVALFFFWWLLIRKPGNRSWLIRPEFAAKAKSTT